MSRVHSQSLRRKVEIERTIMCLELDFSKVELQSSKRPFALGGTLKYRHNHCCSYFMNRTSFIWLRCKMFCAGRFTTQSYNIMKLELKIMCTEFEGQRVELRQKGNKFHFNQNFINSKQKLHCNHHTFHYLPITQTEVSFSQRHKRSGKAEILTKASAIGPFSPTRTRFRTSALYSGPPPFKLSRLHRGMPNSTVPIKNLM